MVVHMSETQTEAFTRGESAWVISPPIAALMQTRVERVETIVETLSRRGAAETVSA
jgi:phage host-nuclease inhibitor protein Gam